MKFYSKIKILILSVFICLCFGTSASFAAYVESPWVYEIAKDNTISIVRYTGNETDVQVPWTFAGMDVKYIGDNAVSSNVKTLRIPDTVSGIGELPDDVSVIPYSISSYEPPQPPVPPEETEPDPEVVPFEDPFEAPEQGLPGGSGSGYDQQIEQSEAAELDFEENGNKENSKENNKENNGENEEREPEPAEPVQEEKTSHFEEDTVNTDDVFADAGEKDPADEAEETGDDTSSGKKKKPSSKQGGSDKEDPDRNIIESIIYNEDGSVNAKAVGGFSGAVAVLAGAAYLIKKRKM